MFHHHWSKVLGSRNQEFIHALEEKPSVVAPRKLISNTFTTKRLESEAVNSSCFHPLDNIDFLMLMTQMMELGEEVREFLFHHPQT